LSYLSFFVSNLRKKSLTERKLDILKLFSKFYDRVILGGNYECYWFLNAEYFSISLGLHLKKGENTQLPFERTKMK
jgi:hypothetical protein